MTRPVTDRPRFDQTPPTLVQGEVTGLPPQWLHVDPEITCRSGGTTDLALVKVIAQAYRSLGEVEPVKVAWLEGRWTLIDGLHRYEAYMQTRDPDCELAVIPVVSLGEAEDVHEARWWASRANWTVQKNLSRKERREAFRRYIQAKRHRLGEKRRGNFKSYRDIAVELPGAKLSTLHRWMGQDFPAIASAMANDPENMTENGGHRDWEAEELSRKAAKLRDQLIALGSAGHGLEEARAAAAEVLTTLDGQTMRPMPEVPGSPAYDFS
ncbi:hypothetical protein FKB34_08755 [Glycocaulis profundi]|nr:hypothetical protein FKB34_08755 [Glycocaulis profundi]